MKRIVVFGSECTGKTEFASALATRLETYWVPEYSREYAMRKPELDMTDVIPIMRGQIDAEEALALRADREGKRFIVCDTMPLSSLAYSQYYNGAIPPGAWALARRQYDLIFLTGIDVPWQNDPVRGRGVDRERMHACFVELLNTLGWTYAPLCGDRESRMAEALHRIETL